MNGSEPINSKPVKKKAEIEKPSEEEELTKWKIIGYSLLITISIAIFVISMIGADPFTLIVAFGISLVFVYFSEETTEEINSKEKNKNS
ncbi:MAG: hypothetical protein R6U96_03325 [Promethearchaeia archaeon]